MQVTIHAYVFGVGYLNDKMENALKAVKDNTT
jgi:hypothetical protein